GDGRAGQALVLGEGDDLIGLRDVEKVVGNLLQVGAAWLGSPDVHAPINDARVCADDLRGDQPGEGHRSRCLAHGRWTGDDDEGRIPQPDPLTAAATTAAAARATRRGG